MRSHKFMNSLLHLVTQLMAKKSKAKENNGGIRCFFVLFIDKRYIYLRSFTLISRSRVQTALKNIGKNVFPLFFYCPLRQLTSLFQKRKQGAPKERAAGSVLSYLGVINFLSTPCYTTGKTTPSP